MMLIKNDVDKDGNLICTECHQPLITSTEGRLTVTATELLRQGEIVSTRDGVFVNHRVCPLQ